MRRSGASVALEAHDTPPFGFDTGRPFDSLVTIPPSRVATIVTTMTVSTTRSVTPSVAATSVMTIPAPTATTAIIVLLLAVFRGTRAPHQVRVLIGGLRREIFSLHSRYLNVSLAVLLLLLAAA